MTNGRGDAVFYFPGHKPITNVEVAITRSGYQPATPTISVTAQSRNFLKVPLASA